MGTREAKSKTTIIIKIVLLLSTVLFSLDATFANPVGGEVVAGNATITQTPGNTQINQTSDKAIINWSSFNIAAGEKTQFNQPSSSSITLNRVDPSQGVSQIFGQLSSNGRLIIVNQAGIYFGPTAHVDVGGIIASTAGITDQNFLAGKFIFDQVSSSHGTVINQGTIIAAQNGLIALIGSNVSNEGFIQARLGNVVLASGEKFTVDLMGDGLVSFTVDAESTAAGKDQNGNTMHDGVKNLGTLAADGGKILLTAKAAQGVVDHVINMEGVAVANSVADRNGEIILSGDSQNSVNVSSEFIASGKYANEVGGTVKILGANIIVKSGTSIDVSGYNGGGEILIGGNYKGLGPEQNALTTLVEANVSLNANAIMNGNGGKVIAWSDGATTFAGNVSALGGIEGGNGGFVETSGHYLNVAGATVNTLAIAGNTGTWLLDPTNIYIALNQSNATAAGMSGTDTSANTESGGTFEASGAVNDSLLTTGSLEAALASSNIIVTTTNASGGGAGNITVVDPITWSSSNSLSLVADNNIIINAGITGTNGSLNLTAIDAAQSITTGSSGTINVANFNLLQGRWYQVGTLPSFSVSNNFQIASGIVNPSGGVEFLRASSGDGSSGNPYVLEDIYGVQGINSSTALTSSYFNLNANIDASSTANWNSGSGFVPLGNISANFFGGGFNGQNYTIDSLYINRPSYDYVGLFGVVYNSTPIQNLNLTNVNFTGGQNAGGIVALALSGSFTNLYTSGTVTQTTATSSFAAGGIIGQLLSGSISNSRSSATVSGIASIGGLVGFLDSASVSNSFTTGNVNGQYTSGGLVGFVASGGTVNNSYSNAYVNVTVQDGGGLVGFTSAGAGAIQNSYSTGYVSGTTNIGGLIGRSDNASVASNSYFDTQTSGQSSSAGSATGLTSAQLQSALPSGFSGATWGIIAGDGTAANGSYPYLLSFNSSTPRVISGYVPTGSASATGLGATSINLAYAGSIIDTVFTGNNGFYYFLESNGTVANGNPFLVYINNAATNANIAGLAAAGGASAFLLNMTANAINIYNNTAGISSTDLGTALGSLSDNDILYSMSGADFNLDGDMTTSGGGALTFNGGVNLSVSANFNTDGNLIFSGNISGNSFTATNSAASTLSIQNNNSQSWNLTSATGGNVTGIGGSNGTFTGFQTLAGGSSGNNTLTTANKTNNLFITGANTGYIDDPINFSGMSSIVGQGTTNVTFNTSATFTSGPSGGAATVNVNGTSMSFSGINSFSGATTPTPATPSVNQSTVNGLISQVTQSTYTSVQVGQSSSTQPQSQSSSTSSSTSSSSSSSTNSTSSDSSSDSSSSDTSTTNSAQLPSSVTTVSDNTAQITQDQQQQDTQQQQNQSFSSSMCGTTTSN